MERGGGGKVCFNRVKLFSLDLSALSPPWNAARYSTRQRAVPSRDFSDGIRRPVKYAVSNFRLQLIHESSRRRACRFELSSSLPFPPLFDYYCIIVYQDQVSMDQKNSHSSYCVNRVRNRFSIEEGWIGRKRKGCEIDRMERKWEAIIGDFYGVFFFYIYRYCRAEDGRINKTEIRELNPVSGSVEILATFQYPRVSSSRNSAGRDPIHFAWPRMLGWTDEPQVHRLLPIVDGLKYLCKTMPVSFPAPIMARPPFSPVRSVEPDTNSLFICSCWIKFALNFV